MAVTDHSVSTGAPSPLGLTLADGGINVAVVSRNATAIWLCLFDGEAALWGVQDEWLPRAVGILDLFHVLERLWAVAHCFHPEKSREAEQFVTHRLRMLLEGRVGYVIGGLRRLMDEHDLRHRASVRATRGRRVAGGVG